MKRCRSSRGLTSSLMVRLQRAGAAFGLPAGQGVFLGAQRKQRSLCVWYMAIPVCLGVGHPCSPRAGGAAGHPEPPVYPLPGLSPCALQHADIVPRPPCHRRALTSVPALSCLSLWFRCCGELPVPSQCPVLQRLQDSDRHRHHGHLQHLQSPL